jgi:hypothetical protein
VKLQIVNKTLSLKPNFVLQFLLLMQKSWGNRRHCTW